ncbi:MAG: hypothetical protein ACYDGR_14185 [Candidatus Dormibacteria bacterium]
MITITADEFDNCIACGRGRGGADRFFCEVCVDNGAPEEVLDDFLFFASDERRNSEMELAIRSSRLAW